jgi:hypothetical protein
MAAHRTSASYLRCVQRVLWNLAAAAAVSQPAAVSWLAAAWLLAAYAVMSVLSCWLLSCHAVGTVPYEYRYYRYCAAVPVPVLSVYYYIVPVWKAHSFAPLQLQSTELQL